MPQENMVISHLKKIALDLNCPLTTSTNEQMDITFSPGVRVAFQVDSESRMLRGEALLGHLPMQKRQETLHDLMKANLLGKEVGSYALGLRADGETIVLVGFFPDEAKELELRLSLEKFLNYAEAWMISVGT